ncbi:MAG: PIN domain-containing protein [Ignavibacteria bacterium]|nr:PIN domain-containing protein [Ignavibacteria bacterium]
MTVLFDTNVVLDVLLEREPHVLPAARLFSLADSGHIRGAICSTTATTIYSIAAKTVGVRKAREQVRNLLGIFDIAPVNKHILLAALDAEFSDHEDAVLHEAARAISADAIATRDRTGFTKATIPALDPRELLAFIATSTK